MFTNHAHWSRSDYSRVIARENTRAGGRTRVDHTQDAEARKSRLSPEVLVSSQLQVAVYALSKFEEGKKWFVIDLGVINAEEGLTHVQGQRRIKSREDLERGTKSFEHRQPRSTTRVDRRWKRHTCVCFKRRLQSRTKPLEINWNFILNSCQTKKLNSYYRVVEGEKLDSGRRTRYNNMACSGTWNEKNLVAFGVIARRLRRMQELARACAPRNTFHTLLGARRCAELTFSHRSQTRDDSGATTTFPRMQHTPQ